MSHVLLINPNTSARTLSAMLAAARPWLPPGLDLAGVHAAAVPAMIVTDDALRDAVPEVVRRGLAGAAQATAIVVAAFGDPGVAELRARLAIPVAGIGESAILEGAAPARRFSIVTTTPGLCPAIAAMARRLTAPTRFAGVRVTPGDPLDLAADPARQLAALAEAVRACIEIDGAEAVVVGGGPLSDTAASLRAAFGAAIVEPVPAAIRRLVRSGRLTPPANGECPGRTDPSRTSPPP